MAFWEAFVGDISVENGCPLRGRNLGWMQVLGSRSTTLAFSSEPLSNHEM